MIAFWSLVLASDQRERMFPFFERSHELDEGHWPDAALIDCHRKAFARRRFVSGPFSSPKPIQAQYDGQWSIGICDTAPIRAEAGDLK
jgi:hypothetical protein